MIKVFVDCWTIRIVGDGMDACLSSPEARDLWEAFNTALRELEHKELEQLKKDLENAAYIAELRRGGYLQKQAIAIAERSTGKSKPKKRK